jgi:DNA-binding response OmpR family regulator
MATRILNVGFDPSLNTTRQLILETWGFEAISACPHDVNEKLEGGRFDLVILSVMLSPEEKERVKALLPADTRVLSLDKLVMPAELKKLIEGELP